MSVSDSLLRFLAKPRVLHRLPGRLRIHVSLLKKLPRDRSDVVNLITSLIAVPDEIRDAQPDLVTGNLLILYDAERAREEDVLGYLNALFDIILRNRRSLERLTAERASERRDQFADFVRTSLGRGLVLDPRLALPRELLAP
jgi:hypothetical protein